MLNDQVDALQLELGSDTIKYLSDLTSESFKRQLELDESVWRSLPFFAATFAFVATIIGKSATDVPHWQVSRPGNVAFIILVAAVASLAWSLRWFWVILRPREYEYPAPDDQVKEYAEGTQKYYVETGIVAPKVLDEKTLAELRLFMIDQYGSASSTNLQHNAAKLKARPKMLLFMLLSFALAFVSEAIIFIDKHMGAQPMEQGVATDGSATTPNAILISSGRIPPSAPKTGSTESPAGERGCRLLGSKLQARNPKQTLSGGSAQHPNSPRKD